MPSVSVSAIALGRNDKTCGATQRVSLDCREGKYNDEYLGNRIKSVAELTEKAATLGERIFVPISKKEMLPAPPYEGGKQRFLVESETALAFQGCAGKDLSKLYHLLIIPTNDFGQGIRWVFDLQRQHMDMLFEMREIGLKFLETNMDWFIEQYGEMSKSELKGKSLSYWLKPENVSFGFHLKPSVGYLHMHMLVGPLTEFGYDEHYKNNWISLESVLDILETEHMSDVLKTLL